MNIVFLATAWGTRFGGINSLNTDLVVAVSQLLGSSGTVVCLVLQSDSDTISRLVGLNITVIPINVLAEVFTPELGELAAGVMKSRFPERQVDFWIGHDVTSGYAALRAAGVAGGSVGIFHHMSYASYQTFKDDVSSVAENKIQTQRQLFQNQRLTFALGPLLAKSGAELSGYDTVELTPGFPEGAKDRSSNDRLAGIALGRMEKSDDRIKQTRLAVAGFADAIRKADSFGFELPAFSDPRFCVVGLNSLSDEHEVRALGERHAGRAMNMLALPFDVDREAVMDRLCSANLAIVPSWHDGFGLVGWEAIAAETPLILGRRSGLYALIKERLGGAGTGCLIGIDVKGSRGTDGQPNYSDDDLGHISAEVLRVGTALSLYKKNAKTLKSLLTSGLGCSCKFPRRPVTHHFCGGVGKWRTAQW